MKTKIFIIIISALTLAFGTAKAQSTETKSETKTEIKTDNKMSEVSAKQSVEQLEKQLRELKTKVEKGEIKTEDAVAEGVRRLGQIIKQMDEKTASKKNEKVTETTTERTDADGKKIIEKKIIIINDGDDKNIVIDDKEMDGKKIEKKIIIKEKDGDDDDEEDTKKSTGSNLKDKLKIKKSDSNRRTKMYFTVALGLNQLTNPNGSNALHPNLDNWRSRNAEVGLLFKSRIGGENSRAKVYYGITYNTYKFRLKNQQLVYNDDSNSTPVKFVTDNNITQAILANNYVQVPFGVEFRIGKSGSLGLGAYAGYRVATRMSTEMNGTKDQTIQSTTYARYKMSNINAGLQASVGKGGLSLYGKYNLTDLFEPSLSSSGNPSTVPYVMGVKWDF